MLQAGGLSLLLELIGLEPDPSDDDSQHAALNAAVALRRLCDTRAHADAFCKARGLTTVVKRLKQNSAHDREPLRLPMPLGPSTVRLECKTLLGKTSEHPSLPQAECHRN